MMQQSFRDKDLTSTDADLNRHTDRVGLDKSSAANPNAEVKAHQLPAAVVGSSAYPQIAAGPLPTRFVDVVEHLDLTRISQSPAAQSLSSLRIATSIVDFRRGDQFGWNAADRHHGPDGDVVQPKRGDAAGCGGQARQPLGRGDQSGRHAPDSTPRPRR